MSLTAAQIRTLHVARKQLGLDEDTYRDALQAHAGVRSSRQLDHDGFAAVLAHFESCGFRLEAPRFQARDADTGNAVTPAQQRYMAGLYRQLGLTERTRQQGFARRQIGKAWPQTQAEASRMIEALKAMVDRGYKARPVKASS